MDKRVIVWFRNDLRLSDNESLLEASAQGQVVPIFVFDTRLFLGDTRQFGFRKTGRHRTKFTIESVRDLKKRLQAIGSDLIVRIGLPEEEIFKLAQTLHTSWVYCNRERMSEEVQVQDALEANLWSVGQELRYARGKMLYHTADLPFPVTQTPDIFSQYRREVERIVPVREPLPSPQALPPLPASVDAGELPSMADFGFEDAVALPKSALIFEGGEQAGLARLKHYLWNTDLAQTYKETRNGLLGEAYSTKFSPYLALGCLSPKTIYHELRRYEEERGANKSTYWIFFELLWRDFFRLMAKKHGTHIFLKRGPKQEEVPNWSEDRERFERWASGTTGVPFIDANMRELNATGWMSNRGRQNVASFLVKDLGINWQMGAEYLESQLIDYDVASNWGNWNYVAGVGSDPREDRYFNILSQAQRYDPDGDFVRAWVPELAKLDANQIHRPDLLTEKEEIALGIRLGVDYPEAMVPISKWKKGKGQSKGRQRGKSSRRRQAPQLDL